MSSTNCSKERHDKSVTPSRARKLDNGDPLSIYDNNSVRDRVKQWQAQGGGVVAAEATVVEDENLDAETKTAKRRISEGKTNTRTHTRRQAEEDLENESLARTTGSPRCRSRSSGAPAKRVVSDGV